MRSIVLILAAGLALAPGRAKAAPPRFSERTVRRFLTSYGYASAVDGVQVRRPDGEHVPLAEVKTPTALLELTRTLERAPFAGLLGLHGDRGAMKIWTENLARADRRWLTRTRPRSPSIEQAHDRAMSELVFGAGPLDERLAAVAKIYAQIGGPHLAQLVQRKLTRVDGGAHHALLTAAHIASARGRNTELGEVLDRIAAEHADRADVLREAARLSAALDPRRALALARKADAVAPADPATQAALGLAALRAGRSDEYTDADGERGPRQAGIDEGLARLRAAAAAGAPVEHGELSVHTQPVPGRDRALLERAVAAYERGRLDEAERVARRALARDDQEGLAHNLLALSRQVRVRRAEAVLLRGERRAPVVETPAQEAELSARASAAGIERIVPGYGALSRDRQATIARSMLPWRAHWSAMIARGSTIYLVPLDRSLTEVADAGVPFGSKTFDGRFWYGVRGSANAAAHRANVGVERADRVLKGTGLDTIAHELAHLVHYAAPTALNDQLEALYAEGMREGRILDPYSRSNVREYFARGYEMWLSHQDSVVGEAVKPDPPPLMAKDRRLYDLITALTREGRAHP